jgi:hypothetical protein
MANRREMSKWKKCKTCGAIMRLAVIHGTPCYVHRFPMEKMICNRRKAAALEKTGETVSG